MPTPATSRAASLPLTSSVGREAMIASRAGRRARCQRVHHDSDCTPVAPNGREARSGPLTLTLSPAVGREDMIVSRAGERGPDRRLCRLIVLAMSVLTCAAFPAVMMAQERAATDEDVGGPPADLRPWGDSLDKAILASRESRRPILLRFGDQNCVWCRVLDEQIASAEVQAVLGAWELVAVDIDDAPSDARRMGVSGVPALRVLTPTGRVVGAQDGSLPAAELVGWLNRSLAAVNSAADESILLKDDPITPAETLKLLEFLAVRDATIREAAIRRMAPWPDRAGTAVVETLADGSLAAQLSAMELLVAWNAPIADIDPWQPDTIDSESLGPIHNWLSGISAQKGHAISETGPLTAAQRSELVALINRMMTVPSSDVTAIREQIARGGIELLPEVYARLKDVDHDDAHERLTALRYRLVCDDRLILTWPGGIERLASTALETRQQAAEELVQLAKAADEALLLELFADPAPIVREISLVALRKIAGNSSESALVRLLDDPEPNIRAAVLKQLSESPSRSIVPAIIRYTAEETDSDLVVHAVRFLREATGNDAIEGLITLLDHESWRVRSESAEAIGHCIKQDSSLSQSLKSKAWTAMLERLDDADAFVVTRCVQALAASTLPTVIDPVADVVEAHPELAPTVVGTLTSLSVAGTKSSSKINDHLVRFCASEHVIVRSAALLAVAKRLGKESRLHIERGFEDPESSVRITAADALVYLAGREFQLKGNLIISQGLPTASGIMNSGTSVSPPQELISNPHIGEESPTFLQSLFGFGRGAPRTSANRVPEPSAPVAAIDVAAEDPKPIDDDATVKIPAGAEASAPDEDSSQPVATAIAYGLGHDKALAQLAGGEMLDPWFPEQDERLTVLLQSENPEERIAAAIGMAAIGRPAEALTVLMSEAEQNPTLMPKVATALKWFPWDKRLELTQLLQTVAQNDANVAALATQLSQTRDARAIDLLWGLLADAKLQSDRLDSVQRAIKQIYFNSSYYYESQVQSFDRQFAVSDLSSRIVAGGLVQQSLAYAMLNEVDQAAAHELAEEQFASADDPQIRQVAFISLLASSSASQAETLAAATIGDNDAALQNLALQCLVSGKPQSALRPVFGSVSVYNSFASPIVPQAPKAIDADRIRPLLDSSDPETRAMANYLLILLGATDDPTVLLNYWRTEGSNIETTRLVYRALAALDNPAWLPVLEDMYQTGVRQRRISQSEFYWTIRTMTGDGILALRQRMRDDIGIEALKGNSAP